AAALRALGADAAYGRMLETGMKPHFIGYYVLVMALQGRPWNDCKGPEKADLRLRFDALKARSYDKGRSDFEAALDAIGVIDRTR
ncbi:MAG: DNA transformation protein, partial [Paracoccaceae bacterium]